MTTDSKPVLYGPEQQFAVFAAYTMPVTEHQLKSLYSDWVNAPFYNGTVWETHASCEQVEKNPCMRTMVMKEFYLEPSGKDFADMFARGYRHALLDELHAFAMSEITNRLLQKYKIFALGNYFRRKRNDFCPVVFATRGLRYLQYDFVYARYRADHRFLFVHV